MSVEQIPSWLRRGLRTWLQAFVGSVLISLTALPTGVMPDTGWLEQALRIALLSAATATLSAAVSMLQNGAEDSGKIPSLLKTPAEQAAARAPTDQHPPS
jgi:hypothetical protein